MELNDLEEAEQEGTTLMALTIDERKWYLHSTWRRDQGRELLKLFLSDGASVWHGETKVTPPSGVAAAEFLRLAKEALSQQTACSFPARPG
jgi:hypothetical protein